MTALYSLAVMLIVMVPSLSFLSASVVLVRMDHPVFAGCTLLLSFLSLPKIETGNWPGKGKANGGKDNEEDKENKGDEEGEE